MPRNGEETRERILEAAQSLILKKGYGGMSIDSVLAATELTKGAFFHHFASKTALASAVLRRYAATDMALFTEFAARADRLSEDPLERVLIFLRLFDEYLDGLDGPYPGCLYAAYTYQSQHFGPDVQVYIADSLARWSALYEEKLDALIRARAPREPVTARQLAELITTVIEGGFVMVNGTGDRHWIQRQTAEFRRYLRLLFQAESRPSFSASA